MVFRCELLHGDGTVTDLVTVNKEGVLIILLPANRILTEVEADRIGERLANLAHSEGNKVLIDLSNVQQMSSAMIGKLLALSKECDDHNITLRLCGMEPHLKEAFKATGLHKLMKIHDTRDHAMAAFRRKFWLW